MTLERRGATDQGLICDAISDVNFGRALLEAIERKRRIKGEVGELIPLQTRAFGALRGPESTPCEPRGLRQIQSNSSIVYGDQLILKVFRRLDDGINPDLEVGRFLLEQKFEGTPRLAASLEHQVDRKPATTIAVVQAFVANQGDAWQFSQEELKRFFERVVSKRDWGGPLPTPRPLVSLLTEESAPVAITSMVGMYLDAARLMGRRTAEVHLALASNADDPEFAPESYSTLYQRSMYQSMRNTMGKVLRLLKSRLPALDEADRRSAESVLAHQDGMSQVFEAFLKQRVTALRTRCHGHLHLGQLLFTGKDFVIIDFEGEAMRAVSDRRRKRSSLRDVAAMSRSFHYAALEALSEAQKAGVLGERGYAAVEPYANLWHTWSSWAYVKGYLAALGNAPFVPHHPQELHTLLAAFYLEKALLELESEMVQGSARMRIPLHGIEQIFAPATPI